MLHVLVFAIATGDMLQKVWVGSNVLQAAEAASEYIAWNAACPCWHIL